MTPETKTPPPHAAVMQLLSGGMIAGAVSALARLGVTDLLDSGPQSAEELAGEGRRAARSALLWLMRATASVGVLVEGPDGRFSQTPMSAVLSRGGSPSLRGWAMMISQDWHLMGWEHLEYCVRTGKQALEDKLYGKHAFSSSLPRIRQPGFSTRL